MTRLIKGVKIKKLQYNCDDRGRLIEIMKCNWPEFQKFGQVYMTTVYPGIIKAWHKHKIQTDNFVCIKGMAKVVLIDKGAGILNEFVIGEHNPQLIQIPPGIYHGFTCVGNKECMIINCCTEAYNPKEPDEYREDIEHFKLYYTWEVKNK